METMLERSQRRASESIFLTILYRPSVCVKGKELLLCTYFFVNNSLHVYMLNEVSLSRVMNFDTFYPSCCPEGGNFDTRFQKMLKSQHLYISPLGLNTDKCIIDLHLIKLNWPWK